MSNCPCALCTPPVNPSNRYIYDVERALFTSAMDHGRERERAAIVAWLREPRGWQWNGLLASRIERGIHLRGDHLGGDDE